MSTRIIANNSRDSRSLLNPLVSVIVLNYNGIKYLKDCFSSLKLTDYPAERLEVIMVDNCSSDDSVDYVKKNFPWVKIFALNQNYGYTGGNNRGSSRARGELLAFLNNDTAVDKAWLRELVAVMLQNERIAICGSKILSLKKPNRVQYEGGLLNLLGSTVFSPIGRRKIRQPYYYTGSVCGASFIMRYKVFKSLNGFDEDFFMYSDENDLCLRAWLLGHSVVYVPSSLVYHVGSSDSIHFETDFHSTSLLNTRILSPLTIYHGNKNSLASIIKNFEIQNMLAGSFFSAIYFFVQLMLLLKAKNTQGIKLLFDAGLWPMRNLRSILKKRSELQRKRVIHDSQLIQKGVLLNIRGLVKLLVVNL